MADVKRKEVEKFLRTQEETIRKQIKKLQGIIAKLPRGPEKTRRRSDLACRRKALKTYQIMQQMTKISCCDEMLDCPDP